MNFLVYEYIFEETRVLEMISRPWLEAGERGIFFNSMLAPDGNDWQVPDYTRDMTQTLFRGP